MNEKQVANALLAIIYSNNTVDVSSVTINYSDANDYVALP